MPVSVFKRANLDEGTLRLFAARSGCRLEPTGASAPTLRSPKSQAPSSREAPIFKHQKPNGEQRRGFDVWILGFGASEAPSAPQCPPVTVYPSALKSSASSASI